MTGTSRVLYLHGDDTPDDAVESLADRAEFVVFTTADVAVACDWLDTDGADCLVVECAVPDEWALQALREVRAVDPNVPCLLFCTDTRVPAGTVSLDVSAVVPRTDADAGDCDARDDVDEAGAAALARHITEVVDAHQRSLVRERERTRLSTFVTESTDAISVVDRDGRFTYVSPAITRLLGYDPDDLVGSETLEYIHPDDHERATTSLERLFESPDGELSEELRLRHADGSWVWVENRGRNLVDDPSVEGVVIYSREISARKRREQRLQRYQSIVEGMSDVAYTVDESFTITYANDRALAYADVPREAVVGQSIRDLSEAMLADESQVDRFLATLERVIGGESDTERLELEIDLPTEVVTADIRITPLRPDGAGDDDTPVGAVVISRDITNRIEYERTLESQNKRLDTFASVISHDLRGPLSIADGNLELARMACRDANFDTVEERLDAVEQAQTRMERLIDDLLVVARQGTRIEDAAPVDLDDLARASWAFVETKAATLTVETGLVVRADERRIQQFFENLFRNAVEHGSTAPRSQTNEETVKHDATGSRSQTGGSVEQGLTTGGDDVGDVASDDQSGDPSVHIRVGALADDDGFFVEDDGPGIPPDVHERVFEGGYSTKSDGTGFGLMIVHEIVEAHDWDVTVTAGTDGGARFEFRGVQVVSE